MRADCLTVTRGIMLRGVSRSCGGLRIGSEAAQGFTLIQRGAAFNENLAKSLGAFRATSKFALVPAAADAGRVSG